MNERILIFLKLSKKTFATFVELGSLELFRKKNKIWKSLNLSIFQEMNYTNRLPYMSLNLRISNSDVRKITGAEEAEELIDQFVKMEDKNFALFNCKFKTL